MKGQLILEDGFRVCGTSFGSEGTALTEVVLNTSMNGYESVWTDPSHAGQLIVMTNPLNGNIGINLREAEAIHPLCDGIIVRHVSRHPSHWRKQMTLSDWCHRHGLFLLGDVDTRMLTRHLRCTGIMKGLVTTEHLSSQAIEQKLAEPLRGDQAERYASRDLQIIPGQGPRIVMIDFGVKKSIVQGFVERDCELVLVPYDVSLEDINTLGADGVVLSNGPGDPREEPFSAALSTIRGLLAQRVPLLGIGLGHHLFGQACQAEVEKMLLGHRSHHHPIKDVESGRGWMTVQNHGYMIRADRVPEEALRVTHVSLNDSTVEGLRHNHLPAFSVQFHPEPGSCVTGQVFDQFIEMVLEGGVSVAQTSSYS